MAGEEEPDRFDLFEAEALERDSRVTVIAAREGREFRAHLRNTGRLEELVYPGASMVCHWKEEGKTEARVLAAVVDGSYVLLDTHLQEKVFAEALRAGEVKGLPPLESVEEQVSYKGKRFDYRIATADGDGFLELKSAVTCSDGWASYPDAPSERGLEHVELLAEFAAGGGPAFVAFVVTDPRCGKFRPNWEVHPEMGEALRKARRCGVKPFATKMVLREDGHVRLRNDALPVNLER